MMADACHGQPKETDREVTMVKPRKKTTIRGKKILHSYQIEPFAQTFLRTFDLGYDPVGTVYQAHLAEECMIIEAPAGREVMEIPYSMVYLVDDSCEQKGRKLVRIELTDGSSEVVFLARKAGQNDGCGHSKQFIEELNKMSPSSRYYWNREDRRAGKPSDPFGIIAPKMMTKILDGGH